MKHLRTAGSEMIPETADHLNRDKTSFVNKDQLKLFSKTFVTSRQ